MKTGIQVCVLIGLVVAVLWIIAPRETVRLTNRTFWDQKVEQRVWGLTYKTVLEDSNLSRWMKQNTPTSAVNDLVWFSTTTSDGAQWSLLAAQIYGASSVIGEKAALDLLRRCQDPAKNDFDTMKEAFRSAFVTRPNSILFTSEKGAAVMRMNVQPPPR